MYEKLVLKKEDPQAQKARDEADSTASGLLWFDVPVDLNCGDVLPTKIGSLCDWQNPIMNLGCRYKDMPTFCPTVRQFAIKNEFKLGIESALSY
jgi:hypothetical protein